MQYPNEGELFKAPQAEGSEKKSEPLIVFVHFYGGHKKALKRHVKLVNELGYDAYVFNLKDSLKEHQYLPYSHVSKKFGLKHALADQIEEHLNILLSYKTKIIFAFSNISACAIECIARRKTSDILALICDSGPGGEFIYSSYRLLEHQMQLKFFPLKIIATPLFAMIWSKDMHRDVTKDLQKFPVGFPILSIRGWKDELISPSHIDQIFEPAKNIHWKKLSLPEATHLTGLRDFPNEYRAGLEDFLKTI